MTDTRDMLLGGRKFAVPPLPLGVTRKVYPLCRQLSLKGGCVDRVIANPNDMVEAIVPADVDMLREIAFACATLVEPSLTEEDFEALPITIPELFNAFFDVARYGTGMWIVPVAGAAEQDQGEAEGEASPRK